MLVTTPIHSWLKKLSFSYVPGPSTKLSEHVAAELIGYLQNQGHTIQTIPSEETNVILTTARLGEPLGWRDSLMFTARHRYKLRHAPMVFTIVHASPEQLDKWMYKIQGILQDNGEADDRFAGVPETAARTLYQQGNRGGAMMYLLRVVQIQTKSIRVLLVVGNEEPQSAYLFDLVGAHPQIHFDRPDSFYGDIATRFLTAASTREITNHKTVEPLIGQREWENLPAIQHMIQASQELGKRHFFTEMIHVSDVAEIPGFSDVISQQYSEGCFATWAVPIDGLLTTITGSARPVQKENISDKDLAVIVGLKPERDGALIRHVEGHPNFPPSSEAVEMVGMDLRLPKILLGNGAQVPVIRSKLHGHRGVRSFDPQQVEYVSVPESYQHYPVSCSTDAQYQAVQEAFSHSSALQNPQDPRQIVFTLLPGHGLVIVEKWVEGKYPFQAIWEAMDENKIQITNFIPQGPFRFEQSGQRCIIVSDTETLDSGIEA
jgi:hypothetical protein